ncbi:hypothetical protein [Psychroflexus sp. MES1-P1E]|uniref:hypothetical protein n=1 Tax=Psychroflexus sp. MES1-P1E TaxID=2058320 RepID=UPI002155EEEF|nr:hypothetical protein [Psychroflexus sp. MES1-P1E]
MKAAKNQNILIYTALPKAKRFKVYIPFLMKAERECFKKLDSSFYHPQQNLWSLINTVENLKKLKVSLAVKCLK